MSYTVGVRLEVGLWGMTVGKTLGKTGNRTGGRIGVRLKRILDETQIYLTIIHIIPVLSVLQFLFRQHETRESHDEHINAIKPANQA